MIKIDNVYHALHERRTGSMPYTSGEPAVVWIPRECPVCMRPEERVSRWALLYDVAVCRRCRNVFAIRRQAAGAVDFTTWLLLSTMGLAAVEVFIGLPSQFGVARLLVLGHSVVFGFLLTLKDAIVGRSPGKLLFGIQVLDSVTRKPIGWLQSLKRNAVLMIPFIGVIGVMLTMVGGRRWGDGWANTMVVWRKHAWRVPFAQSGRQCRQCRQCGYDLTGNVSGRCPECGRAITDA